MKNFRSCFSACVAVTTALVGVGCSSSTQAPTSEQYDDVAQSLSAVVTAQGGGELGSFSATASLASGVTPSGVSADASAQGTFDSSSAGLTYQYSLTCASATGQALAQCGSTTSSARADVTWSGDLSIPDLTAKVQRTGTLSLAGLGSSTVTIQGSGSFSFDAQIESIFHDAQASAELTFTSSYDAITWSTASSHVTGGTAHYVVNASESSTGPSGATSTAFAVDADVTFNPDGSATIVLDGNVKYLLSASGIVIKV